jgi:hypothetical protein
MFRAYAAPLMSPGLEPGDQVKGTTVFNGLSLFLEAFETA